MYRFTSGIQVTLNNFSPKENFSWTTQRAGSARCPKTKLTVAPSTVRYGGGPTAEVAAINFAFRHVASHALGTVGEKFNRRKHGKVSQGIKHPLDVTHYEC